MSCKICGRSSCCISFHSLIEQSEFDRYDAMPHEELVRKCLEFEEEVLYLREEILTLENRLLEAIDD